MYLSALLLLISPSRLTICDYTRMCARGGGAILSQRWFRLQMLKATITITKLLCVLCRHMERCTFTHTGLERCMDTHTRGWTHTQASPEFVAAGGWFCVAAAEAAAVAGQSEKQSTLSESMYSMCVCGRVYMCCDVCAGPVGDATHLQVSEGPSCTTVGSVPSVDVWNIKDHLDSAHSQMDNDVIPTHLLT